MASWTFATEAAPDLRGLSGVRPRRSLVQLMANRGTDVLLVVGVLTLVALLLAFLPHAFSVDSWLALVTGRDVWQSGLPHHDTLTALSYGAPWVDQQWLSQLLSYGAYLTGGLELMAVTNALLLSAALAGCVAGARRLGASASSVLLALPLCAVLVMYSWEVRTQNFVLPLFVATTYLLASDSRQSSRRVYWCLPLLVLWANLHGSVIVGAALVSGYALVEVAGSLWEKPRAVRPRSLVLLAAPWLCMLASPYATSLPHYYRTIFSSGFADSVTEWAPATLTLQHAPLYLLVLSGIWLLGRTGGRASAFEKLAFVGLSLLAFDAVRNLFYAS